MTDTALLFLGAIALGLGIDEYFFQSYHNKANNILRYLYYPPTKESDLRSKKSEHIGAHTDFGTITLLLQDECGGLEVEHPYEKGKFLSAPYIKDAFVVNTGDFLMRWSNDKLKSTLHRVKAPPVDSTSGITRVRYSILFCKC